MYKLCDNPLGIYEKAIPNKFDWATKIKIAKAAGYEFIEMSIDESDERLYRLEWSKEKRLYMKEQLHKQDMYINSICLSAHRKYPFGSKDEKLRQKAYVIMDKAIELAKDLGVRNIQLAGYDVYYEESDETTKKYFVEGLKYATKKAASANIMLSIEIMDTPFIGTVTRCLEYIEMINSPWLQIYADVGNLSQWATEPFVELEKGIHHIIAIHLKDTRPGEFKCVPFGEGTVDFINVFHKLSELDFKGPFLVEMWADNTKDFSIEESIAYIESAKNYLIDKAGELFSAE